MRGCPASSPTNTAATVGGAFSHDQQLKQQLQERLRRGPGEEARRHAAATPQGPPSSRWTLDTIRATFDELAGYTLSGVWRLLGRLDLRLRSARVQQFSPDPEYARKLIDLEMALWEAHRYPRSVVAVFLDEMGFTRESGGRCAAGCVRSWSSSHTARGGCWSMGGCWATA
jgi:hypothetical protein